MKKLNVLIVTCCLALCSVGVNAKKHEQKPNFIQILTDDQGWGDLGSFGHIFIKTPHIDQLAKEGIKFTNCYSAIWYTSDNGPAGPHEYGTFNTS